MPMHQISKHDAISREMFDRALGEWANGAGKTETIGDTSGRGQTAWIHVRELGRVYHLNADSSKEGVGAYVGMLAVDPRVEWSVVENQRGKLNKVALGPSRRVIPGFYLYLADG